MSRVEENAEMTVAEALEKEHATTRVSVAQDHFRRLRLSLHDPSSVSTPQELVDTFQGMDSRKRVLNEQVTVARARQADVTQQKHKLEQDLQNILYMGSSNVALLEQENILELESETATAGLRSHKKAYSTVVSLVQDLRNGLASLLHMCQLESSASVVLKEDTLPDSLERIEKHLLGHLGELNRSNGEEDAPSAGHLSSFPPRDQYDAIDEPVAAAEAELEAEVVRLATPRATLPTSTSKPLPLTINVSKFAAKMKYNVRYVPPEQAEEEDDEAEDEGLLDEEELRLTRR